MTSKIPMLLVVVGLAGCAPVSTPLTIEKFFPLLPGCDTSKATDETFTPNGFLDVAPGNPQFFVGVLLSGAQGFQQNAVEIDRVVLEPENRNRPLLRQLIVTYRLGRPMGIPLRPYTVEFSTAPNLDGLMVAPIQLISPELGDALFNSSLAASDTIDDSVDLFVDVEFTGIMSGSGNAFSTGKATYPIKVFRSTGAACTTPRADPCMYPGQSYYQLFSPAGYSCN
jgi:hypothetical protein